MSALISSQPATRGTGARTRHCRDCRKSILIYIAPSSISRVAQVTQLQQRARQGRWDDIDGEEQICFRQSLLPFYMCEEALIRSLNPQFLDQLGRKAVRRIHFFQL